MRVHWRRVWVDVFAFGLRVVTGPIISTVQIYVNSTVQIILLFTRSKPSDETKIKVLFLMAFSFVSSPDAPVGNTNSRRRKPTARAQSLRR